METLPTDGGSPALAATLSGGKLRWQPINGHGARVQYVVYRVDPSSAGCTPPQSGAHECLFAGTVVGTTRERTFRAEPGSTYRVAAAANYLDVQNGGDLILLGPPITVP